MTSPHTLHRTNAPQTSVAAAYGVNVTKLEDMVAEQIATYGSDGCIADDLLEVFNTSAYSSISARFAGLERKGIIRCGPDRRKGRRGRYQRVMRRI